MSTWSYTGSLNTTRASFTNTLLLDGQVLVTGGYDFPASTYLASCELFDGNTWSFTGSLNIERASHTATLVQSGNIIVVGGFDNTDTASPSCESFNGTTWTNIASLNQARELHTATLLQNGNILVAGGDAANYSLSSCEIFNGSTWSPTGSLNIPRDSHQTILLTDGKVLAIAGFTNTPYTGSALTSCELYNPSTGLWTATGSLNISHGSGFTATLLSNGNVLVTGGDNPDYYPNNNLDICEIYDPNTGLWTISVPLNEGRSSHSATLLSDGNILIAGGYDHNFTQILASCEIFNGTSWTFTANLNDGRAAPDGELNILLLQNNTALIIGVYDNSNYISSCEIYGTPFPPPTTISLTDSIILGEWFSSTQGHTNIWTPQENPSSPDWTNTDGPELI